MTMFHGEVSNRVARIETSHRFSFFFPVAVCNFSRIRIALLASFGVIVLQKMEEMIVGRTCYTALCFPLDIAVNESRLWVIKNDPDSRILSSREGMR